MDPKYENKQNRPYSIVDYDPTWVDKFQTIKKLLQAVFQDKALAIEHMGSTSIPGMKSKPLIDVLVVVRAMETFTREKEVLVSRGYEWKENYIAPDSLIFYKSDSGTKTENIHIFVEGSYRANQFIHTRDYFRAHPERAKEYGNLKEKLKKQFPNDYPAYRAGKQDFLNETERLTKEWKGFSW